MISLKVIRDAVSANPYFEELSYHQFNKLIVVDVQIRGSVQAGRMPIWLDYQLQLRIPKQFPNVLPDVVDNKKSLDMGFEHINSNRSLCLATPLELRIILNCHHPEREFLNLILGYMTQYGYWEKFSQYLIEPRRHGEAGIFEDYASQLGVEKLATAINLLDCLRTYNISWNKPCPCGSGHQLAYCHRKTLLQFCCDLDTLRQVGADLEVLISWKAEIRQRIQYGYVKTNQTR